jgi:hypothetical protein
MPHLAFCQSLESVLDFFLFLCNTVMRGMFYVKEIMRYFTLIALSCLLCFECQARGQFVAQSYSRAIVTENGKVISDDESGNIMSNIDGKTQWACYRNGEMLELNGDGKTWNVKYTPKHNEAAIQMTVDVNKTGLDLDSLTLISDNKDLQAGITSLINWLESTFYKDVDLDKHMLPEQKKAAKAARTPLLQIAERALQSC